MNTRSIETGGRLVTYSSNIFIYSGRYVNQMPNTTDVAGQIHHKLGLHREFLYQPPLPEIVEGMRSGYYVVALNGRLQASASVRPVGETNKKEIGGVVKAIQAEKGLAQVVVTEAVLLAQGMGASRVEARVANSNNKALYFFRDLGAQEREFPEISNHTGRAVTVFDVTHLATELNAI